MIPWNKGKTSVYSKETLRKISENNARVNAGKIGNKNHNWKGPSAKYQAKHKWIREHYGKAKICSYPLCKNKTAKVFHWANISGEYKRVISDYVELCPSCHGLLDKGGSHRAKEMLNSIFKDNL